MPKIEKAAFRRAVDSVATHGDTDIFPFPFENHVFRDSPERIVEILQKASDSFADTMQRTPVLTYSTLAPVTHTGFRWATQIDPLWNAYLLAATISLGPAIEATRLERKLGNVHSYRFQDNADPSVFERGGWTAFQEESRLRAEKSTHVVALDISDFYSRIYHHRLENSLEAIDRGSERTKQIMAILKVVSNNTSYGLPVGGVAARLLAELVLNRVDRLALLDTATSDYCRYADDYRFFVNSVPQAYRAISHVSEKLQQNEGLSLQKSKTRVMTSAEYLSLLLPNEPQPGSVGAFMAFHIHFDPYSANAEAEYESLANSLKEFDVFGLLSAELAKGQIHTTLTRRLVAALRFIEPDQRGAAILSIVDNFESLAPVLPQTLLSLPRSLDGVDDSLAETVHAQIREMIVNDHYLAQIPLNRAYMARVLATRNLPGNEETLARLYPAGSPAIQRDIMLTLARWRALHWLSDQKTQISSAHPWVQRAFIPASYMLGEEGAHWRKARVKSMNDFEVAIRDWAGARANRGGWELPL